jgi:hypothetical protein
MTEAPQREHCEHEDVCRFYVDIYPRPCQEPDCNIPCKHDTRSSPHTPAPEYRDEMTCEHQRIEKYPGDVFTYCQSKNECDFQSFGSDGKTVWCNKPLGSHDAAIARTTTLKTLDKVVEIINKNCFELEGKRLKITPLLLIQEIESLRSTAGEQEDRR